MPEFLKNRPRKFVTHCLDRMPPKVEEIDGNKMQKQNSTPLQFLVFNPSVIDEIWRSSDSIDCQIGKIGPYILTCQSIRYLENTLSDEKSVFRAVLHATPYEHTSALYKAYSYAAAHNKFLWSEFPASNIAPCDRPTFKAMAEEFVQKEEEHRLYVLYETLSLRPWQAYVLERTRSQTDRQITWIYDVTGNSGKTFLALYMVATCNAYLIDGHNKGDIARAYNKQPLVVFSYARQTDDSGINYGLMENFKDGYLWSPKYDSKMMFFNSCKVLVMCNCKPDLEKLSPDRWDCFSQTLQGLRPGLLD